MPRPPDDGHWYQDAIIYELDVATFQDSDGDGIGDFAGLITRLDYLVDLGVTCLWLLPFYPSPDRDNGYDVTDHLDVDARYGGLDGFRAFRDEAARRGLRVMIDLVVQHTSDEHPWFKASRADHLEFRDYYVWTNNPPSSTAARQIMPGPETDIWAWDEGRRAWYLHQFATFEPDLNIECSDVLAEIYAVISHWLDLGVDGFRVDAASLALGAEALQPQPSRQPYEFMRHLRESVNVHSGGGVLMAEAAVVRERLGDYFGGSQGMHMLINFPLPSYLFLALARQEAEPLARGIELLPDPPAGGRWALFLRNLDELNLEELSESERMEVYRHFAPDPDMRIYGRGIRRRLAPMLDGDQRRIKMALSLLLTMPGTPLIVYGDEIGMGEDLRLPGRESVRTVMHWSTASNAGFSSTSSETLPYSVIREGPFTYEHVNVDLQRDDPDSLLSWVRRAIATRKRLPELSRGTYQIIATDDAHVIALRYVWDSGMTLAIHNLSETPRSVALTLPKDSSSLHHDCLSDCEYLPSSDPERIELGPYGYRWIRLDPPGSPSDA